MLVWNIFLSHPRWDIVWLKWILRLNLRLDPSMLRFFVSQKMLFRLFIRKILRFGGFLRVKLVLSECLSALLWLLDANHVHWDGLTTGKNFAVIWWSIFIGGGRLLIRLRLSFQGAWIALNYGQGSSRFVDLKSIQIFFWWWILGFETIFLQTLLNKFVDHSCGIKKCEWVR